MRKRCVSSKPVSMVRILSLQDVIAHFAIIERGRGFLYVKIVKIQVIGCFSNRDLGRAWGMIASSLADTFDNNQKIFGVFHLLQEEPGK